MITIPPAKAGGFLVRFTARLLPGFEGHLMGESARIAYADIMAEQRRDTGTLVSSTNVSAGEAEGRNLTYGPGNSPLPVTVVDQALAARRFGERLVISEDATKNGVAYGIFVEARYGTFASAEARVKAAYVRIVARAAALALKEAVS